MSTFTQLNNKPLDYTLRSIESLDWITLTLVGIFALLAVTRFAYPRRFSEFIQLPITDKYFSLQGKGYEINHPFNVLLFSIQVLCFSLFIFLLLSVFQPNMIAGQWFFIQLTTGIVVFVLLKYVFEKIIAHIFSIEEVINRYLYEKLSYASLLALLLLIGNILFFYIVNPSKLLLWIAMGIILLLFVISLFSSFKRNGNIILTHFFYFILYLCALEIAPYIIVYKLIA